MAKADVRADVRQLVRDRVAILLDEATAERRLAREFAKHAEKIHFIPEHYRVLGGVLQAMNIKFGNFIEGLLADIVRRDTRARLHEASGTRLILPLTEASDRAVDGYITARQQPSSPDLCDDDYAALLDRCLDVERSNRRASQVMRKDVDLLFWDRDDVLVYAELKYNDDHDTGKFVDINRKFIKTYLGLANHVGIHDVERFRGVTYYFNPTKRWGPVYVPSHAVLRGPELFERYLETPFDAVDVALREVGRDPEVVALFDRLVERVRR